MAINMTYSSSGVHMSRGMNLDMSYNVGVTRTITSQPLGETLVKQGEIETIGIDCRAGDERQYTSLGCGLDPLSLFSFLPPNCGQ